MLYLGIDRHARQQTISLRGENVAVCSAPCPPASCLPDNFPFA